MVVDSLETWSQIVIAVGVLVGALITVFKFFVLKPLVRLIDDRTKQIQPEANGGKSLTDLHHRMDNLEQSQRQILELVTKPARKTKQVPPQV
jgi:F0F1-type ATP synthase membrane subunit b/b'